MLKLSERNKAYLDEIMSMDVPMGLALKASRENEVIKNKEKLLNELFDDYHLETLREKQKVLGERVVLAEKEKNEELLNKSLKEFNIISKEINKI